jgi:hypothetical protein
MKLKGTELAEMQAHARVVAKANGIDPDMYVAQIGQESGWDTTIVSKAGAKGLAQFMPATAAQFKIDPTDARASLEAGAKYMAQLKNRFGSEDLARQAYNWGEGNLTKFLEGRSTMPPETQAYNAAIYKKAGVKPPTENVAMAQGTPPPVDSTRRKQPSVRDLAALADNEISTGAAPGSLISQGLAAGNWYDTLARRTADPFAGVTPPVPSGDWMESEGLATLQDKAVSVQNSQMAKMFNDIPIDETAQSIAERLPTTVDRYLDKALSA